MKKIILLLSCILCIQLIAGQKKLVQTSLTLTMPAPNEEYMGSNSATVMWHPFNKTYYVSMVGNGSYPMARFSALGKVLNVRNECGYDLRGMWFDSQSKQIMFNCYSEFGWGLLKLEANGNFGEISIMKEGQNQPSDQCVGQYDAKQNRVYFYNEFDAEVFVYDVANIKQLSKFNVYLSAAKSKDIVSSDDEKAEIKNQYNNYPIFTGMANKEMAFLNLANNSIEFYSKKTGLRTEVRQFPKLNFTLPASFGFSYSNNLFWIFDKDKRTWRSFK